MAAALFSVVSFSAQSSGWTLAGRDLGSVLLQSVNKELEECNRHNVEIYAREHFASCMRLAKENELKVHVARKVDTKLPLTLRFHDLKEEGFEIHTVLKKENIEASKKKVKRVVVSTLTGSVVMAELGAKKRTGNGVKLSLADIERAQEALDREISLIQQLSSTVPFLPTYSVIKFSEKDGFVRTKYQSRLGIDLVEYIYINSAPGCLSHEKLKIVQDLAKTLDALHARHWCHLDLKLDNILLLPDGSIRLIDFGLAAPFGSKIKSRGSVGAIAPEMLLGGLVDAEPSMDLWSLGALCYLLLCCGQDPFDAAQESIIKSSIYEDLTANISFFFGIVDDVRLSLISSSDQMKCMIAKLLSLNPNDRPKTTDFLELVSHLTQV